MIFLLQVLVRRVVRVVVGGSRAAALEVENAVLRHQLAVLRRTVKRPELRRRDRVVLAAASGLLPRSVFAPDWVQYGFAGFLETPHYAFYTSVGLPSWSNLVQFKFYRDPVTAAKNVGATTEQVKLVSEMKKLGSAEEVFHHVVTNAYFRQAYATMAKLADTKDKDKRSVLAEQAREEMQIARATAWALVYYLAKNRKLDLVSRGIVDQLIRHELITEAARQIRGTAVNQVEGAEHAAVCAGRSALILGTF